MTDGIDINHVEMTCGNCGRDHDSKVCHPIWPVLCPLLVAAVLAGNLLAWLTGWTWPA
jgi:hypothetical protein